MLRSPLPIALPRLLATAAFVAPLALAAQGMPGGSTGKAGPVVTTDQVRAELVAHAPQGIGEGQPLSLGLFITHQPHWHTYWKNPGDSGLPTRLTWTLPPGFVAGDIQWPTPKQLPVGPLLNYGFEGELLLPVQVAVPPGFKADAVDVKLEAMWLVCKDVCIPESGEFQLRVPVRAATALHGARFDTTLAAQPRPAEGAVTTAKVEGDALVIEAKGLPASLRGKEVAFFAEQPGVIEHAAKPQQRWSGDALSLRVPLSAQRSESPSAMQAVLTVPGQAAGVQIAFDVAGGWPTTGAVAGTATATAETGAAPAAAAANPAPAPPAANAAAPAASAESLGTALVFAFLGGMLLNLMPCVFPILSLKVLGFAQHGADRRALVSGGLAYTAGVVISFVALAALLLALRAGGEQLGWGFQLQSAPFVAALALLFTLIGLNLSGVFEFGGVLPGNLAAMRARHPLVDHGLTGVLAVAVASPCTAPFMGVALGVALTQPAPLALAIFAALGLGMAAPYLAASLWPGAARLLPRPGVWMARFKALMAFPMFATVVWLIWVLGQQVGIDGAAAMLGVLVAVAFAAWALGSPGFGRIARTAFGALALVVLGASVAWAWPALHQPAVSAAGSSAQQPTGHGASGTDWQPWSHEAVNSALAEGRPVFVDFTAAWCVTCQFNKRTTLADASVIADLQAKRVVLLRADWTRRDEAISAELARLGRNGVPVYALYTPGGNSEPQLLSEILSVAEVRTAMARW
jgi:thiol:disulfide interchange protein